MEAFFFKKTDIALRVFCLADGSSKSNKIEMKREGLPFWNQRSHPWMGLSRIDLLWYEAQTLSNSEDMCVNRKDIPCQTEKK